MSSTDQQQDVDSIAFRLAALEEKINSQQVDDSVASTSTVTMTSTPTATSSSGTGMTYYPVAETALGLTQDGAWHDSYSAPSVVPSDAKYLVLSIRQKLEQNIAVAQEFRITTDTTHAAYWIAAYADWHYGGNGHMFQIQYLAAVGKVFSYYIDNDADYTLTAWVQGYWK